MFMLHPDKKANDMKNRIRILTFVSIVAPLCLASCKKDNPSPVTNTDLLTSKSWIKTKAEVTYSGIMVDVTSSVIPSCQKDDITTFAKDGTYKVSVGADDCGGTATDQTGTWSLTNNGSTLHVTADVNSFDATILALTATTLKGSVQQDNVDINQDGKPDGTVTLTYTFTAK